MTIDRRIEDRLPRVLAELGAGPEPDYADLVLARATHARQRPGWVQPNLWMPRVVAPTIVGRRLAPALGLLLLVLALAAAAVYIGTRPRLPQPFGPARNGAIVYSSGGDILTGTLDGAKTLIVGGSDVDFDPFYAPDGTRIAFYRQVGTTVDTTTDLMVVNADGTGLTRLTEQPLLEIPSLASWTPDSGSVVVLTNQRLDGHLLSFDAIRPTEPRVIDQAVRDLGLRIDSFAFEPPAGRRILFSGQIDIRRGLYTMDADGTNLKTLIEPFVDDIPQSTGPYWSLETDLRELRDSIWSPDGRSIVTQRAEVTTQSGQWRLFMMDRDGHGIHAITTPSSDSIDANPIWSPDGTRIAFLRYDIGKAAWRYAVLRLADGQVTITGPTAPDGLDPNDFEPGLPIIAWSPDGSRLFAVERAGNRNAYILDPDGRPFQTLSGWGVETPHSWGLLGMNGFDIGSWQRLASP
jgi:dipeptidyl aminopeptidase/acylaminoacyl peptidase